MERHASFVRGERDRHAAFLDPRRSDRFLCERDELRRCDGHAEDDRIARRRTRGIPDADDRPVPILGAFDGAHDRLTGIEREETPRACVCPTRGSLNRADPGGEIASRSDQRSHIDRLCDGPEREAKDVTSRHLAGGLDPLEGAAAYRPQERHGDREIGEIARRRLEDPRRDGGESAARIGDGREARLRPRLDLLLSPRARVAWSGPSSTRAISRAAPRDEKTSSAIGAPRNQPSPMSASSAKTPRPG